MAEVLGAIASVLAILEATNWVIGTVKVVKGAKEEIERVTGEMTLVHHLLSALDISIKQDVVSWESTGKLLIQENGPLEKFRVTMLDMKSKLAPEDSGHKRMIQGMLWPFQKKDVDQFLQTVERVKSTFILALSNDQIRLQKHIKDSVNTISRISLDRETRDILQWLCPLDFALQQRDLINQRTEGTNQLFLNSDEFQTWLNRKKQILVGFGIPGSGKTMTASAVIQHLEESSGDESIGLAYVFCDYKKREEQSGFNLIASLLKQLVYGRGEGVPKYLQDLYEKGHPPTLDDISKLFQSQVSKNVYTYIVIDALDECGDEVNTEARGTLLSMLRLLLSTDTIGLMITSRPTNKLREDDFGIRPLELEITASEEDLDAYLSSPEVMGRLRLRSLIAKRLDLQQKIKRAIIKAVDGMFILAPFHMEQLRNLSNEKKLKKALETLPAGKDALNKVYDGTMQRIKALETSSRESAMRILTWVIHACRPLSITELQHALAIEVDEDSFDEENIFDIEEDISLCAGLVTIDRERKIVQLFHKTAHEYFSLRKADLFPQAQSMLAETCLTYLCYDVFRGGLCVSLEELDARLANNSFLGYSAQYWGQHALGNEDGNLIERIQTFFKKTGNIACASQVMLKTKKFDSRYVRYTKQGAYKSTHLSAVHICAFFGLTTSLADMLRKGLKVDEGDDAGRTPLWWACLRGQKAAVSLLLEQGADVFTISRDSRNVLQEAAGNASPEIFQLLLLHARNDDVGRDLLSAAAANERWGRDIVKILFQSELSISNEEKHIVAMAALRNQQCGRDILEFLACSRGWDIKISDDVVEVLSNDFYSGADKLALLLSLDTGRNLDSTVYQIAVRGWVSEVLDLLLKRQPEFHFTHDDVLAAADRDEDMFSIVLAQETELELNQTHLEEIVQKFSITPIAVEAVLKHSELKITESVMICATKNTSDSCVLEWLLDHHLNSGDIPESLFVQAAGSEKAPLMLEALACRAPGFKLSPVVVIAALFAPIQAGHESLEWLLNYYTDFTISETTIVAGLLSHCRSTEKKRFLRTHFPKVSPGLLRLVNTAEEDIDYRRFGVNIAFEKLSLLSSRSPGMAFSKNILSAASATEYPAMALEFIISQQHNIADAELLEGILILVMKNSGFIENINTVLSLVSDASIVISPAILEAAARNSHTVDALEWSLKRYSESETIPTSVVRAAARGRYGIEKLKLLRAYDPNNFQVTEDIVVKACWAATLQWIFAEYPSIRVTESAMITAAARRDAVVAMELIMKHDPDIQITENILIPAIIRRSNINRTAVLEWLLNRQKVHITERVLIAAARTHLAVRFFEILNDYQPGLDICSNAILQAAAENFHGPKTLQWLLACNSDDTPDPTSTLSAQTVMNAFLQRQSQPRFTEPMIVAAVGYGWRGETLDILLEHSITFSVTTEILEKVSQWEGGPETLQLLLEKTNHGPISQDLIDAVEGHWEFGGRVFDILDAHNEKCSLQI